MSSVTPPASIPTVFALPLDGDERSVCPTPLPDAAASGADRTTLSVSESADGDDDSATSVVLDKTKLKMGAAHHSVSIGLKKAKFHARIEENSSDGKYARQQKTFFQENQATILQCMDDIEEHVKTKVIDFREVLTVYPMTGKVIWIDTSGNRHTTRLLTAEKGVPTCLESLRNVYEKAGWKTDRWATYDVHTKANGNGAKSLNRDTGRLQNAYKCTKKDKEKALDAVPDAGAKIDLMADLYRAQKLKAHLVDMYEKLAEFSRANAKAEPDTSIAEEHNVTAKNLEDKAAYFKGEGHESFDWNSVNLALLNPINCSSVNAMGGLGDLSKIVDKTAALKKQVADKIQAYPGDKPKHDFLSGFANAIPLPLIGKGINIIAHLATDRTDHTLDASEHDMAVDVALLGIEHEDLEMQRLIAEKCYGANGVHVTKIRKDPVEFLAIKLIAVTKRGDDVRTQVLDNSVIDNALTSGLSSDIAENIRNQMVGFANGMKTVEKELSLHDPVNNTKGMKSAGLTTVAEFETAFKNHVVGLGMEEPADLPDGK